tara:strand:- start:109 stop:486 length:378 start_codon:yes stop_codon:yes gene_type:complete
MSIKISQPKLREYLRSKYGSDWWKNKTKQEKDELKKIAAYHLTHPESQIPSDTCDEKKMGSPMSHNTVSCETKNICDDDDELTKLRIELLRLKREAYLQEEKRKVRNEIEILKSGLGETPNILNL